MQADTVILSGIYKVHAAAQPLRKSPRELLGEDTHPPNLGCAPAKKVSELVNFQEVNVKGVRTVGSVEDCGTCLPHEQLEGHAAFWKE